MTLVSTVVLMTRHDSPPVADGYVPPQLWARSASLAPCIHEQPHSPFLQAHGPGIFLVMHPRGLLPPWIRASCCVPDLSLTCLSVLYLPEKHRLSALDDPSWCWVFSNLPAPFTCHTTQRGQFPPIRAGSGSLWACPRIASVILGHCFITTGWVPTITETVVSWF